VPGLDELTYPFHDQTVMVTHCGRLCFKGRKVNLSQVFAGQNVGRSDQKCYPCARRNELSPM
jgi:hypothetical protein